jgi:uncharacterized membrane protein
MATTTTTTATASGADRSRRRSTAGGILLGLGLGGFVDGIVLHQLLQWHHMLTDYGGHASFPATTVASLEQNTRWDGLFHASTWLFVAVGVVLMWRALAAGAHVSGRRFVGLLLTGWGLFNLVEGLVDHHLLSVHHVRDDVADPLWWDLGFLALGALLIVAGVALGRRDRPAAAAAADDHEAVVDLRRPVVVHDRTRTRR